MSTLYLYRVLVGQRDVKRGLISASDRRDATTVLLARFQHAIVLSLSQFPNWLGTLVRRTVHLDFALPLKELAPLLRQMALLLKAGVPIEECLQNLIEDARDEKDSRAVNVLQRLFADLQSGLQLSAGMARQPDTFPEMVLCLATVGDQTGLIGEALMDSADYLDKTLKIRSNIKHALIYPFFTFGAMFAAAAFWIAYVIPNMAALFKQMNAKLPAITVKTMAAAEWLTENYGWIALVVITLVVTHIVLWQSKVRYRIVVLRVLSRTPIVRHLLLMTTLSVIFENLRVLYGSGIDLVRALDITRQSIKNDWYLQLFEQVTRKISQGFTLTDSMRSAKFFPRVSLTIVSAGERSGTLDAQFRYLSQHYADKLDAMVKNLAEVIKPLIVIVAGGFFIFMIVALLLPVYDLVKQTMAAMK